MLSCLQPQSWSNNLEISINMITINTIRIFNCALIFLIINLDISAQSRIGYLTKDGAWCWFSDPRAVMVDKNIITGWVKSDGTIEAAIIYTSSDSIQTSELYYKLEAEQFQ